MITIAAIEISVASKPYSTRPCPRCTRCMARRSHWLNWRRIISYPRPRNRTVHAWVRPTT